VIHNENVSCAQIFNNVAHLSMLDFIRRIYKKPSRVPWLNGRLSNELVWQHVVDM
jgi:hypothetical protein